MEQLRFSLDYIRQVLAEYFAGKPGCQAEVFGSSARGEATAESTKTLQLALERQFEVPDEAASYVSITTQEQYPALKWQRIKSFRKLLAHNCFRIDCAAVWHISQQVAPTVQSTLKALFASLDQQFGPDARV